ncbi:MAG: putative toxin-antitoxin system toxin component, PIN family [Desulfovibrionaceae bacterium]|nr:putative toxin-antitoxin system toxin component, PIN family [Desulfovibrionaceae bacterium]
MRVVLDTNVLLSALLTPHGVSDAIYRAWRKNRFNLVTSVEQIDELRHASRYAKFRNALQPHRVGTMVNNMSRSIVQDTLPPLPDGLKVNDPDDAFLLAMALAGEADYLVTGDRRAGLLQRGSVGRARIVTPAAFCAEAL